MAFSVFTALSLADFENLPETFRIRVNCIHMDTWKRHAYTSTSLAMAMKNWLLAINATAFAGRSLSLSLYLSLTFSNSMDLHIVALRIHNDSAQEW